MWKARISVFQIDMRHEAYRQEEIYTYQIGYSLKLDSVFDSTEYISLAISIGFKGSEE